MVVFVIVSLVLGWILPVALAFVVWCVFLEGNRNPVQFITSGEYKRGISREEALTYASAGVIGMAAGALLLGRILYSFGRISELSYTAVQVVSILVLLPLIAILVMTRD